LSPSVDNLEDDGVEASGRNCGEATQWMGDLAPICVMCVYAWTVGDLSLLRLIKQLCDIYDYYYYHHHHHHHHHHLLLLLLLPYMTTITYNYYYYYYHHHHHHHLLLLTTTTTTTTYYYYYYY